jgi:hypothetical protein
MVVEPTDLPSINPGPTVVATDGVLDPQATSNDEGGCVVPSE